MTENIPFENALQQFTQELTGRNMSALTITAYGTDIKQFITFLQKNDFTITSCDKITKQEINDFLNHLAEQGRSGVTRARKLAAIKEFFEFLVSSSVIPLSPAKDMNMPIREKKQRVYLRPDEYIKLLSASGGNPRDYAILQLFLQTGIRVGELVELKTSDIDLGQKTMTILSGKGKKERIIDLEKRGLQALKSYLNIRQTLEDGVTDDHLFLNYQGEGISDRGVKKIIEKYSKLSGIQKKISCHSLRHTFGTYKAERGVSAFQLQQWLGHSSIQTSAIYVHMTRTPQSRKIMENTSLPS